MRTALPFFWTRGPASAPWFGDCALAHLWPHLPQVSLQVPEDRPTWRLCPSFRTKFWEPQTPEFPPQMAGGCGLFPRSILSRAEAGHP